METSPPPDLEQRYRTLLQRIATLSASRPNSAALLAVSKGQAAERVRALFNLGQRRFGENYAQELIGKANELADLPIAWTYIGQLQSNKIKKIVAVATEIQTVTSFRHAEQIARAAIELGRAPYPIYLELNVEDEATKTGLSWEAVLPLARMISAELPALQLKGLMAIPPSLYQDDSQSEVPALYRQLRSLADQVGAGLLSLGMSGDMTLALAAGSDLVRIGQALMGPRRP